MSDFFKEAGSLKGFGPGTEIPKAVVGILGRLMG